MFENLQVFRTAHAMAVHAGTRQAVVARNMANADTPGYAARDIPAFKDMVDGTTRPFALRATRAGHLTDSAGTLSATVIRRDDQPTNPNGNGVTLEDEMLKAVAVKRQHDRAIAIYKSSLNILRTAVGHR
ncbi:FlgB family protein [Roseovarius salinarum]|uniref:FlgB family protein n=1 Tax=Roseovarius salinarum TaxID=1981892 RepID=UPI000C31D5B8|nr:FlgB family protein [Roseovarius salinarum]